MKKIVFTGGGTAGHIYPILAVKERMNKSDYQFFYIGGNGMEKDIIANEKDISFHEISTVKLQRKLTLKNLLIPFKLIKAISQSKKLLKEIKPDVIFSKGGFVAVPVVIAGAKLGIPVISHESDLSMGLANKIILHYCNTMCTTFEETKKENQKTIHTGQPIRKSVLNGNKKNLSLLNKLDKQKPVLLVIGGSSGAKFINEKIIGNLDKICSTYNCIHITGKQEVKKVRHENYFQVQYAENIGDYLNACDVVLSRAGSGAINEFLALKKPMLLIPLSKKCSRGDQIENAKLFSSHGFCDMIEEEDCDDSIFYIKLANLYKNREKYVKNMKKYNNFDACEKIIEIIKQNEK